MGLSEWSSNAVYTFKKRFKKLLEETTVKEAASKIGASVGSISNWAATKNDIQPSISNLANIASAFKVSPNYLLGYEKNESASERMRKVMEYTGLEETAVKKLHDVQNDISLLSVINYILSNEEILNSLKKYFSAELYKEFDEKYKYLPKYNTYIQNKYESYHIIEALSIGREDYTKCVQRNLKQRQEIIDSFLEHEVEWRYCLQIYTADEKERKFLLNQYRMYNRDCTDEDILNMFLAIDVYYDGDEAIANYEYYDNDESDNEVDDDSDMDNESINSSEDNCV